jgi:AcrR family transcriptional regulator
VGDVTPLTRASWAMRRRRSAIIGRVSDDVVARSRPFVPPDAPKTRKSEATRRRVLGVAAQLFVKQGYDAVSMRDIAEKADLTHGGIYGHFRTKGQLLVEVIRWKYAERVESPEFIAAVNDPNRSASLLVDESGRDIRLLEVDAAAAARHSPDVATGMRELYVDRHAAIRSAIADDVPDPDTAAWIIALIDAGVGMKNALGDEPPDHQRFLATLQSMLASLTREVPPNVQLGADAAIDEPGR